MVMKGEAGVLCGIINIHPTMFTNWTNVDVNPGVMS